MDGDFPINDEGVESLLSRDASAFFKDGFVWRLWETPPKYPKSHGISSKRNIDYTYLYIYKIIQFSSFSPKTRYKRRHGAILWDTRTPLFVVENQMAKVPEPCNLTLRSEDWSVDCNPKSVNINGTLIQIWNGVTYQLYIYIFYIYIYLYKIIQIGILFVYIYICIFLNLYMYIYI